MTERPFDEPADHEAGPHRTGSAEGHADKAEAEANATHDQPDATPGRTDSEEDDAEPLGSSQVPVGEFPEGVTVPDDTSALDGVTTTLAEELLADLQRVQAEYVNYRKRVDRDREVAKDRAHAAMLEALLPVLDDIELARQHGDLVGGPFAAIAEKLEGTLGRYGLERYGDPGTPFDPAVHEALLHSESGEVTEPTVTQVLQPGYMIRDKVLRAARVAVSAPA